MFAALLEEGMPALGKHQTTLGLSAVRKARWLFQGGQAGRWWNWAKGGKEWAWEGWVRARHKAAVSPE